jgi:hypothetical protein
MPDGHIDNFLIPCFCRKLFEDKHPTKSGRHYFFSYVGVFLILNPLNVIISSLMLGYVVMINSLFFQQESILDFSSSLHENIVRTSFLGAASASLIEYVASLYYINVYFSYCSICSFPFNQNEFMLLLCSFFSLYVTWNTGLHLWLISSGSFLLFLIHSMAQNLNIS